MCVSACPPPPQVVTDSALKTIKAAHVQQAFLPKFENEGQDSHIADQIVAQVGCWVRGGLSRAPLRAPGGGAGLMVRGQTGALLHLKRPAGSGFSGSRQETRV